MPALVEVNYFNSFWLKKIVDDGLQWGSSGAASSLGGGTPNDQTAYQAIWPGTDPAGANVCNTNLATFGLGFYPTVSHGGIDQEKRCWFVEEARIRGGYNNTIVDLGVKAYITEETPSTFHRPSAMIYSGVFNSKTNFNETNQFPTGEEITKVADPHYSSIQKLYAEDSNLIIFQEDKVSRGLIDKDAIYSAEGGGTVTSSNVVIGQITPYVGEYGISRNPESFAKYGFRKYFADKDRGVVLRLSRDGITEISAYGLSDYFRDELSSISDNRVNYVLDLTAATAGTSLTTFNIDNNGTWSSSETTPQMGSIVSTVDSAGNVTTVSGCYVIGVISLANFCLIEVTKSIDITGVGETIRFTNSAFPKMPGGWDIHNRNYTLSLQEGSNYFPLPTQNFNEQTLLPPSLGYATVAFDDAINGWVSFYTYNPTFMASLKDVYYSFFNGYIYKHYSNNQIVKNYQIFYGVQSESSITFVFNPSPSINKNFLTINYEGSNGWEMDAIGSGYQGYQTAPAAGNTPPWDQNYPNNLNGNWVQFQDEGVSVKSNSMSGYYDASGNFQYAGFTRKENKYVANLINNSPTMPQEVIYGPSGVINNSTSGIKGYFSTVKMSTDLKTDPHGPKELFSVGSVYQISST